MSRLFWCACLFCALCLLPCDAQAELSGQAVYPGYRSLSYSLPSQHILLKLSVWYPARRKPRTVKEGDWSFRAARSAPVLHGPWPMLILSHDSAETSLSHHDLAAALAMRGFIVVAPLHDHDNADDMRLLFHDLQLVMRAMQLRSAVDFILEHPQIGPEIDRSRIGYVGFGTPASAGLLLAGAQLTPDGWAAFCSKDAGAARGEGKGQAQKASPGNAAAGEKADGKPGGALASRKPAPSPWCRDMLAYRMERLVSSMRERTQEMASKKSYAANASADRARVFKRLSDFAERNHRRIMRQSGDALLPPPPVALPLLPPLSGEATLSDPRFRALAFVSPGYSFLFEKASLAAIRRPALFIGLEKDSLNIPLEQASRFADMMEGDVRYALLHGADARAVSAPCPPNSPLFPLESICGGNSQTRTRVHHALLDLLGDFFMQALPSPAPRTE